MPKEKSTKAKKTGKSPHATWRPLTAKEVDLVLKNETTFAEYLVTLSVDQINAYLLLLKNDKSMDKASRDSFIALLKELREERAEADKQAVLALAPLMSSVGTIEMLDTQIAALEEIEREMNSAS